MIDETGLNFSLSDRIQSEQRLVPDKQELYVAFLRKLRFTKGTHTRNSLINVAIPEWLLSSVI